MVRIGVLALQGAFREHLLMLGSLGVDSRKVTRRSEEHTSELQSSFDLVCRLLSLPSFPTRRSSDLPTAVAKASRGLGDAMVGINVADVPAPHRLAERGW